VIGTRLGPEPVAGPGLSGARDRSTRRCPVDWSCSSASTARDRGQHAGARPRRARTATCAARRRRTGGQILLDAEAARPAC
jgi:hypothetical protein